LIIAIRAGITCPFGSNYAPKKEKKENL